MSDDAEIPLQRDPAEILSMVRSFADIASEMFCGPGEDAAAYVVDLIDGECVCAAPIGAARATQFCPVHRELQ